MSQIAALLGGSRIIPVLTVDAAKDAVPVAEALREGGLPLAEVTLRTPAALDAIARLAQEEGFLVGAGTVTRAADVPGILDAGAKFIVSPGFSPSVVRECQSRGVPVLPGISTATELQMAVEAGINVVKFFPAEAAGGIAAVSAISSPFPDVRFVPTGGVGPGNLTDYLDVSCVLAVGGSWMASRELIRQGDFATIRALAARAFSAATRNGYEA
jgi:2-dehydro-3-deoxyphosphogluconate aldolase/(4S)-4-hydroxy-2-oxoglutarate aldolase